MQILKNLGYSRQFFNFFHNIGPDLTFARKAAPTLLFQLISNEWNMLADSINIRVPSPLIAHHRLPATLKYLSIKPKAINYLP